MMQYGCIGEHLPHSFSKEIHEKIGDYEYELKELAPDELDGFMRERDFRAINVTIPYKQAVIPYLYEIDPKAAKVGAVNTIVNRDGRLYGYNTDVEGMDRLIKRAGATLSGKKVLILGTGGTSKTALALATDKGASRAVRVSRTQKEGCVTYEQAYVECSDFEIIINTTPCGMFPHSEESPTEPERFKKLEAVFDAVYNPLETELTARAKKLGVTAENGLYMLAAQAVAAYGIFMGTEPEAELTDEVYSQVLRDKQSIVLIGMPSSGKTTIGQILARDLERRFFDTDDLIKQKIGEEIPDIFKRIGESGFREIEAEVIRDLSTVNGAVIATGGGAILREDNVRMLKRNGKLYFLDRPLELLIPTDDRPLSGTADALKKRYEERYDKYVSAADEIIKVRNDAEAAAQETERRHGYETACDKRP